MKPVKVVAIVQARYASRRLPGKVLADIAGKPMLLRVVERAARSREIDEVGVATTVRADDDAVADLCRKSGVECYRGSPQDVLDRYWQAAQAWEADWVVRLTADCPLMDASLIDELVGAFHAADPPLDFAANRLPGDRTVPIGLDIEMCTRAALGRAWREAAEPHQREHVMPYFYENPGRFRILHLRHSPPWGDLRWTVDTAEDLAFVRAVYARFAGAEAFGWREVLDLVRKEPDLARINAGVPHKTQRDVEIPSQDAEAGRAEPC
jgi:spore coat polysaccharide biosynthesis protein SpsF